jgi:ABC-2 type transport system permease protein
MKDMDSRDTGLLIKTSIKNNIHLKIPLIVYIIVTILSVTGITLIFLIISILPEMEKGAPDIATLELFSSIIIFTACTLGVGVNLNAFAFNSIIREKTSGTIESLLATPLRAESIWIARSIAIFIPGLAVGEFLGVLVMIILNYIYFIPKIGFILNPWAALSSFIIVPLVFLALSLLSHLVGLTGRAASANIIVQIFLPVFANVMINLSIHHVLEITSWTFAAANFGVAAAIFIISFFFKGRLKKERIVLSG